MNTAGVITGLSVSHVDASVDDIEAAADESERAVVRELLGCEGVTEAFALQTCNRVEAYVVTGDVSAGCRVFTDYATDVPDGAVAYMGHEDSLRHLMRVAAGLESLVVGEDQILGQFKRAVEAAREVGGLGPMFEHALTKAIHVGERARTETGINEGSVSLGSAAVDLASRELDLSRSSALVVGAGKMGTLAARSLADAEVASLTVANRTLERAAALANEVDGEAVPLSALPDALAAADLVIAATASDGYVVDASRVDLAGETTLVDLAQPRDVDPELDGDAGVTVHDIDALEAVTDETRETRREAAAAVESMIDEEFDRLLADYKRRRADEAIAAMYESAERVKSRELDTALAKLDAQGDLTDEQRETVEAMADALVGQLLAAPTKSLREAAGEDDWTTIQTAMRLFDPEFGDGRASTGPMPTAPSGADGDVDGVPPVESSADD